MPPQVISAKLSSVFSDQVILILDVCDLDVESQNKIIVFIKTLLNRLPKNMNKSIYFMGNASRHSDYLFESQSAQWFEQNRHRTSLISPIINQFDKEYRARVILIGSNPIFDLEDWIGHGIIENAIQVCIGKPENGESTFHQILHDPTADEVSLLINNPIDSIHIQGQGLMPLAWNNSDYKIEQNGNIFSLSASVAVDYFIELISFIADPNSMLCTITYLNGQQVHQQLVTNVTSKPLRTKDFSKQLFLTPEEVNIFRKASAHKNPVCLRCGQIHDWDQLHCYAGESLMGNYIYPSIPSIWRGLVLFHDVGHHIFFENQINNIFPRGDNSVILVIDSKVQLCRFNEVRGEWEAGEDNTKNYLEVEDGTFLVFL